MKREFVINRHGKDYVLYAGLLDEAHQQGLRSIKTQLLQAPMPQNGDVAICFAEVTTERGTFTGIGDAEPGNVSRAMANALIRLAETRAKARALRDAVNVNMLSVEELSETAPESIAVDGQDRMDEPRRLVPVPMATTGQASRTANGSNAEGGTQVSQGSHGNQTAPRTVASVAAPPAGHALPPGIVPLVPRHSSNHGAPPAQAAQGAQAMQSGEAPAPEAQAAQAAQPAQATQAAPDPLRQRRIRETAGASSGGAKAASDAVPATPTQLETIAKLARSVGRAVPVSDLTRASASELITRLSEERYGTRRSN